MAAIKRYEAVCVRWNGVTFKKIVKGLDKDDCKCKLKRRGIVAVSFKRVEDK
jgi:hypothetical protein